MRLLFCSVANTTLLGVGVSPKLVEHIMIHLSSWLLLSHELQTLLQWAHMVMP